MGLAPVIKLRDQLLLCIQCCTFIDYTANHFVSVNKSTSHFEVSKNSRENKKQHIFKHNYNENYFPN